jgi:hypothetical protein
VCRSVGSPLFKYFWYIRVLENVIRIFGSLEYTSGGKSVPITLCDHNPQQDYEDLHRKRHLTVNCNLYGRQMHSPCLSPARKGLVALPIETRPDEIYWQSIDLRRACSIKLRYQLQISAKDVTLQSTLRESKRDINKQLQVRMAQALVLP